MQNHKDNKEIMGLNRITKKRIMELCKKDKLYQTPELNDVLYLHYQGFECIECLEDYTELKCLWLECNAISEIQGLEKQAKLKCLFLQSNLIRKIENLDYCKELDTINLSQNHIRKIENCGFEVLPVLNTLNLSSNYIKDCEGLRELENCKNLSVLDLSNNRIDDILVVKIFGKMQELKVLVLQGNPVVSKIPQYRKTLILECKKLTYLDSRPVFPKDRACAEAWKRGGYEEERKENERWNRRERKKMRDGVNATIKLRNRNRKPEDQLTLIPSSDSEDESGESEKKKNLKNCVTLDGDIDSMWDEVAGDMQSERSSISVTSAESKTSDSEKVVTEIERKNDAESKISDSEEGEKVVALKEQKESDEEIVAGDKQSDRSFSSSTTSESNTTNSIQSLESGNEEELKKDRQEHKKSVKDQQKSQSEEHISEKQENMEKSKDFENNLKTERKEITSLTNLNENKDSREQNQTIREIKVKSTRTENSLEPPTKKVHLQIENCEGLENSSEKMKVTTLVTSQHHKDAQESELYHEISMLKEKETISLKVQDPSTEKLQLPIQNCNGLDQSSESTLAPRLTEDIKHVESKLNHSVGVLEQETPKSGDLLESSSKKVQLHIENYKGIQKFNVSESSENYEITIEAIRNLTKPEDSPELFLQKNNEFLNTTLEIEKTNEENYEALEEMEETMNILKQESKDLNTPFLKHKRDVKKTLEDLETEEKRLKVNEKVKTDFEELSTNLNNFVEQLDQEQKERQEVFKALFNKDMKPKESSEEVSENEESEHLEESKLESMIKQWDEETRLKKSPTKIPLDDKDQLGEKAAAETKEDLKDSLESSSANITKISDTQSYEENKVKSCSTFSEYIPLDISLLTRQSNEALNSLERESKELKRLLQQLEDKNEDLFRDTNAETKCEREENIAENEGNGKEILEKRTLVKPINETENKDLELEIKCEKEQGISERNQDFVRDLKAEIKCERENRFPQQQGEVETEEAGKNNKEQSDEEDDIEANFKELKSKLFKENVEENKDQPQIVQTIVEELLKTLELKQKSLEFPECFECPEDLNTETQPPKQTITSSLLEFAESFKEFYKDIENKNQEKLNLFDDKEQQKSAVLKELTKHTNLKQFNNDSLESLNAQLSEIKRVEHAKVRRMVDRVYAQKDRYNDTLELVDGKLMVRHRDTHELRELPQPVVQDSTDSEVDYDTAESGEEECYRGRSSKVEKRVKRKPFKPTARKSSEELIVQALIANKSNKTSDDSEESNDDEFYSLDPQDPGNLYKEIDKEFFHKLTLDHVKLSQLDENHVVQCARSYEELKHGLRLNKEERGFTEEENELMESMIERKFLSVNENPGNLRETLQSKSDLKSEEKLWLNKEKDLDVKDEIELKSSKEAMQLFGYKYDTNTEFDREKDLEDFEPKPKAKSENLMKQILLKKLAEQKENLENEITSKSEKPEHNKKDREAVLSYERQSEEEKNELESNIDLENGASNAKIFKCHEKQELKEEELRSEVEQLNTADELIRDKDDILVGDNSPGVELVECNLEIIGCNDELVDTIIVNAEVHF